MCAFPGGPPEAPSTPIIRQSPTFTTMLNKYPLWKYLLVLFVLLVGLFYAAPNLYSPDPALQITGESSAQLIDQGTLRRALAALDEADIEHFGETLDPGRPQRPGPAA